MKNTILFYAVCLILFAGSCNKADTTHKIGVIKYTPVSLSAITPHGWLKNQLDVMSRGSTGHIDEIYPKLMDDNGWLGGKGDSWEETPYWLDGAVPLAYLIKDEKLIQKVGKYIDWCIDNQRPSGYFGPVTAYERESGDHISPTTAEKGEDWWPRMIMLKMMQQYYSATKDARVPDFMMKYFNYQKEALKAVPIGHFSEWSQARGFENIQAILWLYTITKDESLLELAELIRTQSFRWTDWFNDRDWVIYAAANQTGEKWQERHSVNVAMALKAPSLAYICSGDDNYLTIQKKALNDLMLLHGLPHGCFSGDEDIHGNEPSQGTELCTIVEFMYSLENMISITGDPLYMDALERVTYNALPAQTTDDYENKQYYQIANQPEVRLGSFDFSLTAHKGTSNVYGTASGYTCCYTNMHQAWPKFTASLWYFTSDNGVASLIYAPSEIKVNINETEVVIREETNYPFEETVKFHFTLEKENAFPFHFRIPGWCKAPKILVNNTAVDVIINDQMVIINRNWKNNDKVELQFPMEITTGSWARNSRTIERGPLVYGLKIKEKWIKGHDAKDGDYWSVMPESKWNYGLLKKAVENPGENVKIKTTNSIDPSGFIWNQANAPIELIVPAKELPWWKPEESGALKQPVTDRQGIYKGLVSDKEEEITLIPYGCTKIRIAAFPVIE